MSKHSGNTLLVASLVLALGSARPSCGATYSAVAYMTGQNSQPIGIAEGVPGLFFVQASGTLIFSTTTQGATIIVASFPDPPYTVGSGPGAVAANGLLYSSISQTTGNGSGNIISMSSTAGSEDTYAAQNFAMIPLAGTLPGGKLFGLAYAFSNASYNIGTTDLSGNMTTLYQFPTTDRAIAPVYGSDGNYYGTAFTYGSQNGYFYKVTPSGSFTKVATLPFAGAGIVLQGTDGNFYGVQPTSAGCSNTGQHGAVYKMTPTGQFTTLHDFGLCGNAVVNSLIEGSDGKLYGAIQGNSALFSLTRSGTYKVEFKTDNGNTQGLCTCILTQGGDGIIYGTASGGGPGGYGVVFALNAGLPVPKPKAREFTPRSGAVGARVQIWGYNLLNASVTFDGVPATEVSNSGPNYVLATVPHGATTGPVTVATPGGASTTHASFTVK
jgi:uncharacterized repeat protein (TIGR03803 family)